jgi:hypothetical protein
MLEIVVSQRLPIPKVGEPGVASGFVERDAGRW